VNGAKYQKAAGAKVSSRPSSPGAVSSPPSYQFSIKDNTKAGRPERNTKPEPDRHRRKKRNGGISQKQKGGTDKYERCLGGGVGHESVSIGVGAGLYAGSLLSENNRSAAWRDTSTKNREKKARLAIR